MSEAQLIEGAEPREISGMTTSLILSYVEREGGADAVDRVLEQAGLTGWKEELRDEDRWFADRRRVDLFHAAERVLDDPGVARHAGEAALELNTGQALKLALRSLGSPRLIYTNIARANGKFNVAHEMTLLDIGEGRATLRNVPIGETVYDPCDCKYNEGLLSCVPVIFGQPAAKVHHPICIGRGASECVFEVEWLERRSAAAWVLAGFVLLAVGMLYTPILPFAALAAALAAGFAVRAAMELRGAKMKGLEVRVDEQAESAERMMSSLKELVSALRLDEVLEKITENAQAAIGGAEFALLVREGDRLRCRSSSDLPRAHLEWIEAWAEGTELPLDGSITIDDLRGDDRLARLAEDATHPARALCASPLVARGESLGVLVALSSGAGAFLPRDVVQLESYAAQAAIALTNARLYEAQQELANEDPLTALYNHRHFHETIERELDRCRRYGAQMSVAIFDLDGFKLVNDRGGHAEGDRVLRSVAAALRRERRRSDLAFRVGGDEFALILPATRSTDAEGVARRAAEAIVGAGPVEVSWGVASWPDAGLSKDALLSAADDAMYEMKRGARGELTTGVSDRAPSAPGARPGQTERLLCTSRLAVRLAPMTRAGPIAATVIEELVRTLKLDIAEILELDVAEAVLRAVASGGSLIESRPELRFWEQPVTAGILGRTARVGESVVVADTTTDPAFTGSEAERYCRSELATPIRAGGEIWGVLNLQHEEADAFGRDDLLFAETVAAACGAAIHRSQLYGELESAFTRTLAVLSDALEAKDAYTAAHAREVSELAEGVAARMGMSDESIRNVGYGALLHDIGKIGVRGEILRKPGKLTDSEDEEMKEHTVLGARMLERIPFFAEVHPLVRASHERWDGRGYPDRLLGEEIPLGARIIGACDAFHAMTSDRPYRRAMSVERARDELARGAGSQFDPDVTEVLLELIGVDAEAAAEPERQITPAG